MIQTHLHVCTDLLVAILIVMIVFCFIIALHDALKKEIQHFKVLTGQAMPNGGPMMNFSSFGAGQQFYSNNQAMHTHLTTQQFQKLQIHSQKQQHQLQQQTGNLKIRGSMSSPSQKENAADVNSDVMKEC